MKQTFLKAYESPKAEVIEIESQGVLCASAGPASATNPVGNGGIHFGTTEGGW
jgi:hypothetical protein